MGFYTNGYAVVFNSTGFCDLTWNGTNIIISGSMGAGTGVSHAIRVTRDALGNLALYIDGVLQGMATDGHYTSGTVFSLGSFRVNYGLFSITNIRFSFTKDGVFATSDSPSSWISPTIDRGSALSANGIFTATTDTPTGTSVTFYTAASTDGITWDAWSVATPGKQDPCALKRYERVKIILNCPEDDGLHNAVLTTPIVYGITVSWYTGTGQQKWSPNINFYLTDSNGIQDLQQQIGDSLGGDSQIINDVALTAAPLILDTTDGASTQWQATAGSLSAGTYSPGPPPSWVGTYTASATAANVSASAPLIVAVGTVSFICVVEGGMNIANMNSTPVGFSAGATITNGCINLTSGTAVGSAYISFISPTTPVLTLVITTAGTITNLFLSGYGYTNLNTPYKSIANDQQSINRYKRRHQDIENDYVQNSVMTGTIAARVISNQKNPIEYIPSFKIFPPVVNMQPGDRVNVTDEITGIADDYYVVSFSRKASVSEGQASVSMTAILSEVPIA